MSFDINQFRSQMTGDGARPNLFEVIMPFPTIARLNGTANAGAPEPKLTFMCRTSQLPGSTIGSVPVNYFGRELKFAGNRTVPEWTITVINDEDFLVRNTIENWMNSINSSRTNIRVSNGLSPLSYTTDVLVNQHGKADNGGFQGPIIKQYKGIGLFPIDLSPIDLDWGANDTIEEFSVTFAVQWWEDTRNNIL